MDGVGKGSYGVFPEVVSNDEIGRLRRHFNAMAGKINTLINQVYQEEMLHRGAAIRALQQQINPHFLYNELEIINALTNRGTRTG